MYANQTSAQYNHGYPNDYSSFQVPYYNNTNFICPFYMQNPQMDEFPQSNITQSELILLNQLRNLWEQHTVWTRATIVSLVFGLPDVNFVTTRLLQNPEDFGNVFAAFYGDEVGLRFRDLLINHLVIAAELVKAAKAGDNKAVAEIEKRWYANGDDMAAFLASINPYWSEEEWRMMFRTHLDLVKSEAVNLLTQNYPAEASVYDELETQALEMADMMTQGIIMQFSEEFKCFF